MIGIIVPTKNRSDFMIRLVNYYANINSPYTLYIGDSSDKDHSERILTVVKRRENKIKIVYKYYPDTIFSPECVKGPAVIKELLGITTEKYAAFCCDDDFLVPNSLGECALFLEANSDYSTAQGKAALFTLSCEGAYGQIESLGAYKIKESRGQTPSDRLDHFLGDYWVPQFSVHRTKEFLEDHDNVEKLTEMGFCELLPNCRSIVRGKSKRLDCFYLVRQVHSQRWPHPPTLLDAILQSTWQPSFQIYSDTLTAVLMAEEGLSQEIALDIVKQAFGKYLGRGFCRMLRTHKRSRLSYFKDIVKHNSMLKQIHYQILSSFPIFKKGINLPRLLNPSSKYYEDFIPIYKEIARNS